MSQPNRVEQEVTIDDIKKEVASEVQKKEVGKRIQLISFKLGSEEYALPIDQIKEVVLTPRIARMPHSPEYIKGVANIRGNIIAILDLEQKFGLTSPEKEELANLSNYVLVIENEVFKVAILVKEVPNTLTVNSTDIDDTSNFIQYSTLDEKTIRGVVKLGSRLIILIDIQKMMEIDNIHGVVNKALQ